MKTAFILLLLRIERAGHMVDAYLAQCRGEMVESAEWEAKARECERRIDVIELNRRFGYDH